MDNEIKIGVEIASHPDNRNDDIITFYKEGDNCVIEIGGHAVVAARVQVTLAQLRAMMNVIDAQKSQLFRNIETRPDKWPNTPVVPYNTPPIINYRDGTMPMPCSISLQTKPS